MTGPVPLACDEVHCWCVTLDVLPETAARLYATLTDDERQRSAHLRSERDRQRFIVAHGALRELLGCYLETDPDEIRFGHNAYGKPHLSPESGSPLQFNLSHSAGLALIAIAAEADIGVDLEYVRAQPDYTDIARRFFSADEFEQLDGLPRHLQPQAFFRCWTQKEAYLKACGEGLAGLDGASHGITQARHWSLYTVQPARGYIGALVIAGSGWHLREWHWQASGPRRYGGHYVALNGPEWS